MKTSFRLLALLLVLSMLVAACGGAAAARCRCGNARHHALEHRRGLQLGADADQAAIGITEKLLGASLYVGEAHATLTR